MFGPLFGGFTLILWRMKNCKKIKDMSVIFKKVSQLNCMFGEKNKL